MYNIAERWKSFINKDLYNVYHFTNSSKHIYSLIIQFISLMRNISGYTFILSDDHIDDSIFAIFLEYGIQTGNRVVFARNQDEVYRAFRKYTTKPNYYCLDLC